MAESILVTGVAGSGKSTVCVELQKRGYQAFNIEEIPGLFAHVDKQSGKPVISHSNDDLESVKTRNWVCSKAKLEALIQSHNQDTAFYCGIASNIDELLSLFGKVFLLEATPEEIRNRLSQRKAGEFGNVKEIQD